MTFLHWHCWVVFPVKEGDTVAQGQPVACMGNSGFCMVGGKVVPVELRTKQPFPGTHDHFEVRVNGEYVDPMKYIDWDIPIKYDALTTMKEILLKIFNILK
jgi:murein DD-endopeptidase MepM/ murein hydrolase activator NlpD